MPLTIRLEDVRDHIAFRHKLQRKSDGSLRPLADITWTIGGREVEVSDSEIEEHEFRGWNNIDFAAMELLPRVERGVLPEDGA